LPALLPSKGRGAGFLLPLHKEPANQELVNDLLKSDFFRVSDARDPRCFSTENASWILLLPGLPGEFL